MLVVGGIHPRSRATLRCIFIFLLFSLLFCFGGIDLILALAPLRVSYQWAFSFFAPRKVSLPMGIFFFAPLRVSYQWAVAKLQHGQHFLFLFYTKPDIKP
jgi:hypothetical protein